MRYNASRIAALLGRFGNKQQSEAILEMWQRSSPATLKRAIERRGEKQSTVIPMPLPQQVIEVLQQPCISPQQVSERKEAVRAAIAAQPPSVVAPTLASALAQQCEREIQTEFGTRQESSVIQLFEQRFGTRVRPDLALYTKSFVHEDQELTLQGRLDGRLEDGRILEIKNRVHRLFNKVRDYEMMQVQTYLELTNAPGAILCEAYHNQLAWQAIQRDPEWWRSNVLLPLFKTNQTLTQLLSDPEQQDRLLDFDS